jgi:acetyl-CoA/propionyl-CoA carboxylase carboxyl transferase subunit
MASALTSGYAASPTGDIGREGPRERLTRLLDPGSAMPIGCAGNEGALGTHGTVMGVDVVAFATAHTRAGGALRSDDCELIVRMYDEALRRSCPIIGLWHSGGAHLREGVASLHGVARVFAAMTRASGRVPQLSIVLGAAAGAAAYGPALTDIVLLVPEGRIFVTGPDVVRAVTGEQVDAQGLGGPEPHARHTGVVHVVVADTASAYATARRLVDLLGAGGRFDFADLEDRELGHLVPESPRQGYDVRRLVDRLVDHPGVELQPKWGPSIVTALGRLAGRTVGVVANNPLRLAGCLDSASAEKAARFVRTCDSFGIPLIAIVDVPGYLPGVKQEWSGLVRRGAKLLHAFAECTVPRVTVVLRKAYGGAYVAMNSRGLGATKVFAWPQAEVAVMGAPAAIGILHRRELAAISATERVYVEERLLAEHRQAVGGLQRAVDLGVVDEVIQPAQTRRKVAEALAAAGEQRGRHGNIPL